MIALVFSPMPHTKSISLADLLLSIYMTYIQNFAQPPGETSHCYALFLHGSRSCPAFRVASSAPEAGRRCIRRLRNGHAAVVEQLISAGATVDAADNDGRGLGRVFGSFWAWL